MKERDDSSNWFSKWEEDLPPPDELMPLSQSLITPDLALAFDITNALSSSNHHHAPPPHRPLLHRPSDLPPSPSIGATSADFATADSGGAGADEPARTLKRPRLVWTPQLHKRFVDAVAHLGIKNAVPKTIMQLMNVDGLTRENVASHLQKYRLYLKRMQGLSASGGGGSAATSSDPATDHLFASSPVPPHFLHPGRSNNNSDHYLPFVPVASLQHHQQLAAAAAAHPQIQMPYHRPVAQFGSPPNGQFDHPFLSRQGNHRLSSAIHAPVQPYPHDLDSTNGGRKALTLFPTGDD